jgi:hypothetical protein
VFAPSATRSIVTGRWAANGPFFKINNEDSISSLAALTWPLEELATRMLSAIARDAASSDWLLFLRLLRNLNACPDDRVPNETFGNHRLRERFELSFCHEAKVLRGELYGCYGARCCASGCHSEDHKCPHAVSFRGGS